MDTSTFSIRLPLALRRALEKRAIELGFASFSAYLVGIGRDDLMTRGSKERVVWLSKQSPFSQDEVDLAIVDHFTKGIPVPEGLLEKQICDRCRGPKSKGCRS